jgi:hypothetical protein
MGFPARFRIGRRSEWPHSRIVYRRNDDKIHASPEESLDFEVASDSLAGMVN